MKKTIKNILVPVNFSQSSDNAVQTGIAMCKSHGAVLHLLYNKEQGYNVFPPGKNAEILGLMLEAEMANLDRLEAEANRIMEENNIVCFYHISNGALHRSIASKASDLYCDLIIIEKEKTALSLSLIKPNSIYKTIKQAECPVLAVPQEEKPVDFKKVLFPVRPVRASLKKLEVSLPIIRKGSSRVLVLGLVGTRTKETERKRVDTFVLKADEEISKLDVKVDKELNTVENMANQVVKKAIEKHSDLIVITATIEKGMRSLFFKDYTERVIASSPVAALSVKQ